MAARDRLGRVARCGRDRHADAFGQGRHRPEFLAGARQRPRLSRGLVARRDRRAARLARFRDGRAALHRPPFVGRGRAREKSRSRHARSRRRAPCARRGVWLFRPACAGHGAPPARAVGDAASLARRRRPVRQSLHPQRVASFDPRRRSPARAQRAPRAITRDILDRLLATCGRGRAVDLRDRALLLLAFGSGGRRRSEIARLRVDDLEEREPVPADPSAPEGPMLPVLAIRLRRTKTSSADAGESALIVGRPVDALRAWLEFSKIDGGPVFRRIDKWGQHRRGGARSAERQRDRSRAVAPPPASIRRNIRRMDCGRATSPRRRGKGCRCQRPCSNRSIAPCNRRRAITMKRKSRGAGPRGWRKE